MLFLNVYSFVLIIYFPFLRLEGFLEEFYSENVIREINLTCRVKSQF